MKEGFCMFLLDLLRRAAAFLLSGIISLSAASGSVVGFTQGEPIIAEKRRIATTMISC